MVRETLGVLDVDRGLLRLPGPLIAVELVVTATGPADLTAVVLELTGPDGHPCRVDLAAFGRPSSWVRQPDRWVVEQPASARLRVLIDGGLVEIFCDDGRAAATSDLALASVHSVALAGARRGTRVVVSRIAPLQVLD